LAPALFFGNRTRTIGAERGDVITFLEISRRFYPRLVAQVSIHKLRLDLEVTPTALGHV